MDLVFRIHPYIAIGVPLIYIGHSVGTYRIESARTKIRKVLFALMNG